MVDFLNAAIIRVDGPISHGVYVPVVTESVMTHIVACCGHQEAEFIKLRKIENFAEFVLSQHDSSHL